MFTKKLSIAVALFLISVSYIHAADTKEAETADAKPRLQVTNLRMTYTSKSASYQLTRKLFSPLVVDGGSASFQAAATGGEPATGGGSSESYAVAKGFWPDYSTGGCCGMYTGGQTGNIDCSDDGKRNLADITRLIDRVYITKAVLCCEENGNVDGDVDDKINLADITRLIDHVYISKVETAVCN